MNISLENIDKVSAVLTIKMEKADYADKVEKSLKDYRKKASIPGFRPGLAPLSLLKKRFGKEITAEEVNKLLGEKLYAYIKENNLNVLGEPLPNETRQQDIDFGTMDSFEFVFDLALAPEFDVTVNGDDTVDYYNITVDDKMVDDQVKMYTQRAGGYDKVDSYEEKDMLKGLLAELDETGNTKEGGIQVENAVLLPEYFKNDEQKAIFNGCKVNDVLVFNPSKAYEGRDVEISALLKISKSEVPSMTADFSFQVQEITRFKAAEINQELFDQVFGKGVISTEEEFRSKIASVLSEQFTADSDYKFILDLKTYLMAKVGKLDYSEAILKRYMRLTNKDKDEKFIEDNFEKSLEELTWHLIKEKLAKMFDVKVEQEDLKEMAKNITKIQFAQYGMINVPEQLLENYANEMLQKKGQVDSLINRCVDEKIAKAVKSVVKLDNKQVNVEDFNKMFA